MELLSGRSFTTLARIMAVKPGDPILQNLTAAWFNRLSVPQRGLGGGGGIDSFDHLLITVRNHSTTRRDIYTSVFLDTPHFDYAKEFDHTHNRIVINTTSSYSTISYDRNNFAILQEPLDGAIGATATALLKGITWLQVPTADLELTLNTYLFKPTETTLSYGYEGKAEILHRVVVNTKNYFLVNLGNIPIQRHRFFVLTENMAAYVGGYVRLTARAMAEFFDVSGTYLFDDYVYSWDGIVDDQEAGFEGVALLMDNHWVFNQATCNQGIISS